jgi:hypothetical protein
MSKCAITFFGPTFLFTFVVSSRLMGRDEKKVKAPQARDEGKSYRRHSNVIEGNYKMTYYKFDMYSIEVTNFEHRFRACRCLCMSDWNTYAIGNKLPVLRQSFNIFSLFITNSKTFIDKLQGHVLIIQTKVDFRKK